MRLYHQRNCSIMQTSFSPRSQALNTALSQSPGETGETGSDLEQWIRLLGPPTPTRFPRHNMLAHTAGETANARLFFFRGYSKTWGSKIISIIGSIKSLQLIEPLAEINSSVIDTWSLAISFYFRFPPSYPFSHLRVLLTSPSHNTELEDVSFVLWPS